MPQIVNLAKEKLDKIPKFLVLREVGKSRVELFFHEDAAYIASLFSHPDFEGSPYRDPEYWKDYNSECVARLSFKMVMKSISGRKRKKGYYSDYNIRKMFVCPKSHECPDRKLVCRPYNSYLPAGYFACKCREPADGSGKYPT